MTTPKVEPTNIKCYIVKQSKYQVVGTLPIRRMFLGPPGSGKTVLVQKLVLDIYKD